ncbi:hypothetical protein MAFF211479_01240 [Ralstonia solanacearum]|nr:hypothetical protein MAFF211479_01240 [Ralstonia solanacearum]BCL95759.1 hypothetical protein MAFF211491_02110 [Ralstonia solanacearum]BCM11021.1 hypothetical protein MAFF241648_02110 [Ralstonia solanacearum]BCN02987.1 hypothetical protein RPSB_01240 [Ralstonia solanacearum]
MESFPASTYKGYDIYLVILRFDAPREWWERRPDRPYSASMVICTEGASPSARHAKMYSMKAGQWESVECAKHAALRLAQNIIDSDAGPCADGLVAGALDRAKSSIRRRRHRYASRRAQHG